jgi:hypothetical protein
VSHECPGHMQARVAHLLFALCQVKHNGVKISEATLRESQADTVSVGRATAAVESKSWHFRGVQEFGEDSGVVGDKLRHARVDRSRKVGQAF